MAEKKTAYTPTKEDAVFSDGRVYVGANKRVNVIIPKEPGVKDQLPVYVNASEKTALIDRGKTVNVTASAAAILQESDRMREISDNYYSKVSQ